MKCESKDLCNEVGRRLTNRFVQHLADRDLSLVQGGAQSKGEEMCEITEEFELSQSHTAA